ncbi:ATPase [Arthrobacter sp. MYb211]|uniref:SRPBCC family protein n=1 Tax=Micrococcaceae TaxID=1268 RepID=UPI000CFDA193|nr:MULTISPECIES: SRPBCC family protein [unclassified Arthrobacter]PRA00391.1 ATPase [Arthrobacter sp. MYb224]PRA04583.1 ATPase [Arthrobacter sp. MYb229]PRA12323.1 ATPase [Arthrobacter sp. MYb221]PRB51505.1 ATPase [Arthrobacter sp. MYb216]PRC08786.1 ATPase [Arthrobacter sp. MYb211]
MVDVTTSIVIHRPLRAVADYAVDPLNAPAWYRNIRSVRRLTDGEFSIGARAAFEARFLGRELSYVYEVIELVPEKLLVMSTAQGPFPMRTSYRFETVDAHSTRVRLRNDGQPAGFGRIFAPLMAPLMRRANAADLRALKQILESTER